MQGLHPAVEHLREAGVIGDLGHAHARVPEEAGGAAGGNQADAQSGEPAREIDDPGLVRDTEQGLPDDSHHAVGGKRRTTRAANRYFTRSPLPAYGRRRQNLMPCALIFLRSVLRLMPSIAAAWDWLPRTR